MENQKCTKTKRFVLFGVLTFLTILIGWHIYAHFLYADALKQQHLNKIQLEICNFTRLLYDLDVKHNTHLVKTNFQTKINANTHNDELASEPHQWPVDCHVNQPHYAYFIKYLTNVTVA